MRIASLRKVVNRFTILITVTQYLGSICFAATDLSVTIDGIFLFLVLVFAKWAPVFVSVLCHDSSLCRFVLLRFD